MNIKNKYIAVIGAGESGVGSALLAQKQGAIVFVSDSKTIKENYREELNSYGIEFEENGHSVDKIKEAHLVIKSPGIPPSATIFKEIDKAARKEI